MVLAAGPVLPQTSPSLEVDARRLAGVVERHRYWVVLLLTVVYGLGAILHARAKPLWYDEIITTVAATEPTAAATWETAQKIDINPPLVHLLMHYSMRWFSKPEIGARIPSIVGFWIFCLCLYRFTRRRLGIFYALAALLLPVVTSAYVYAVEARGYGPSLAFSGVALLAWQTAAGRTGRGWALPVLAVSLAGATMCHYYTVLLYMPLAGGEAFRWYRTRKFDAGIWAAFAVGGSALLWRISVIAGSSAELAAHSWTPPSPEQILEFWETGLQHSLAFVVLLVALLALSIVAGRKSLEPEPEAPVALEDHELIAGVLFLAIPIAAVAVALLITHVFTIRYALFSLAGFAYLVPMLTARLSNGRTLVGFLLTITLLAGLGVMTMETPPVQDPFLHEPILAKALQTDDVIISDGVLFLQMWQYAPAPLKSRILYLADGEAAVKYMQSDIVDNGLRAIRPWSTARIMDYRNFFAPGREFLVYQNAVQPGWLLPKLMQEEGTAKIEAYGGYRELIRVRFRK